MKKKVNIFGKSIPVFVIALLGLAVVSAALVPYLSNMVSGDVEVISPIKQEIGPTEGELGPGPLPLGTMHGGESQTFFMRTTNLAADPITGEVMNLVTSAPVGTIVVSCSDFTLSARTKTDSGGYSVYYTPTCTVIDTTTLRIHYGPADVITWAGGQVDTTEVTVTFEVNAFGTYEFSSQVMD